ncbi:YvrJ family protein [Pontibacillus yanchengensis]|nr:YvrJ family protein [Pontibacillus yanchengensis]
MEQWMTWIPEIGFPVVLSFYLLHRMEGKLDMLISSIHSLAENRRG